MIEKLTQSDLDTASKNPEYGISLLGFIQDSQSAKTSEQRLLANEAAKQLRNSYGVQTEDSAGIPVQSSDVTGSFNYQNNSAYNQLLEGIVNGQQNFQYDLNNDPVWGVYKKQYLREADRAAANTLAQISAGSGGTPSSHAVTAAQQARNYYAGQLTDMIPTLEQNAYTRYITEKMNGLGALQNDRDFAYQAYLNQITLKKQEEQERYDRALASYQLLGYATPEVAEILGLNTEGQSTGGSGSGSGYGSGYSGYNNGTLSFAEIKTLQQYFGASPDGMWGPASSAAAGGLTADEAWTIYKQEATSEELAGESGNKPFTGTTYKEAAQYLKALNIPTSGLMTDLEWARHKNGNNSAGGEHEATSYQEYINAYVFGKLAEYAMAVT